MNYKKLIREALGLDLLFNLNKEEKIALKSLHRKYQDLKYDFELNTNKMVDDVEDLGFNFTTSVKLASLYRNNRDLLFKDYHEKYYHLDEAKILYSAFNKYAGPGSDESKLTSLLRERFNTSLLAKNFGISDFYISLWINFGEEISFYIHYSGEKLKRWKCIMTYNYSELVNMSGDIKQIPFIIKLRDIEYDFPMPELEGSKDKINIPINFDIENIEKNDIYEIIFGQNNSLFSDFDERLMEIISISS